MNPLLAGDATRALLALEDGTTFEGLSAGATGETFGELVFNTSMSGYQEVVTDPSYAGQVVAFTYPQIGNYGVCAEDMQSTGTALAGVVVHDMCHTPNNWRSEGTLPDFLAEHGIVAIEGVDTRELTLRVRDAGTMRCAISTTDLDPASLVARVKAAPSISETNWVAKVSTPEPYEVSAKVNLDQPRKTYKVIALDCGEKRGILRGLVGVAWTCASCPGTPRPSRFLPPSLTACSSPTAPATRASCRASTPRPPSSSARCPSLASALATR